jgi:GT2 family glycosyltransferase
MSLLIVTPTLNRSRYLDETIASVRSYAPDAEHILSAPSNEVEALRARYPELQVVADKGREGGMYGAINAGIETAESNWEWFTYINDDDVLYPGFSHMVKMHLSKENAEDFVHGIVDHIDEAGMLLFSIPACPWASLFRYLIPSGVSPLSQQGMLIKRAALERIGHYDQSFKYAADMEFYCRLYMNGGRFAFSRHRVAAFRICSQQLSSEIAPFEEEKARIRAQYFEQPSRIMCILSKCIFTGYNMPKYLNRLQSVGFKTSRSMMER